MPDLQSRHYPDFVAARESRSGPSRHSGRCSTSVAFGAKRTLPDYIRCISSPLSVPQRSNASASKRIRCCAHALRTRRSAAARHRDSSAAARNGSAIARAKYSRAMCRSAGIAAVGRSAHKTIPRQQGREAQWSRRFRGRGRAVRDSVRDAGAVRRRRW